MTYNADDIQVLAEMEHLQLNPGMYTDTSSPAHLVEEALDNALDEALAGYATIIAVDINPKTRVCSVIDNGRGIPLEKNTPVTISTKLFSGGKFKNKKSAYKICAGLHGVGLVAVNAFSEKYMVDVYRDGKHGFFYFEKGKLKKSKISQFNGQVPYSTKIEFIPSGDYFEETLPNLDRIRMRLTTASAELGRDIHFVMKVSEEKEVFNRTRSEHFKAECDIKQEDFIPVCLHAEHKEEKFEIYFGYDDEGSNTAKVISSVNLLPVNGRGSHFNTFIDLLITFFLEKGRKLGFKFQGKDILVKLRAYLVMYLVNPELAGQTKEKLTNRKNEFEKFVKIFKLQLEEWAETNPDILESYLEKFESYRLKLESKDLKKTNTRGKRASTKFTKLRDCSQPNGELYIVEGASAGGSIIQSRDPEKHAVLPLRGKSIPNITSAKNILKNKEVGELIMALGMGVEPHCNIENLRYERVVCATDADPDGAHIACLLTMVIAMLVPDLIRESKYFIAQTPLFAINEKRTFKPLWTEKQLIKAREGKRTISRFKGLGELNPNQLKVCLLQESTRHHIPVKYSEDIDELLKLFSNVDAKRKLVSEK